VSNAGSETPLADAASEDIILFCFHANFDVCRERIAILHALNPGIPIYGLYGGPQEEESAAHSALDPFLVDIQPCSFVHSSEWKWMHPDLMIKNWYRNFGRHLEFERLYGYEWDILTAAALRKICPPIDASTVALCSLTEWSPFIEEHWSWARGPGYLKFRAYAAVKFGMESLPYMSHGPGPVLPRPFLEKYAATEDIDFTISEMALPAYAVALGFRVINNNFRGPFLEQNPYFNCRGIEIKRNSIVEQLADPHGRRVFHPVKGMVTRKDLGLGL
jgi:hypothetical protein